VILIAFSGLVGLVAMPTLAAVLILAGLGSIRLPVIATIWQAGPQSQIAMVTTFLATLFLPVAAAVGIGVALSLLLQVNREAMDVRVVRLVSTPEGLREEPAPRTLASDQVLLLDVYGSLFYAGARTLEHHLPEIGETTHPVVVLRMRGRRTLGATAFAVFSNYATRLGERGGRLYLSGVDESVLEQFHRFGVKGDSGSLRIGPAEPLLGASTRHVLEEAEAWLVHQQPRVDEIEGHEDPGPGFLAKVWRWLRSLIGTGH
jgi:SulP family sulfate permease